MVMETFFWAAGTSRLRKCTVNIGQRKGGQTSGVETMKVR
jgi:hypothetical protein